MRECVRVLAYVRMILHCMRSMRLRACATGKQVRLLRCEVAEAAAQSNTVDTRGGDTHPGHPL
jgi:hypothetical protein